MACVTGGIVSVRDQSFGGWAVIQKREWGRAADASRGGLVAKFHSATTQYRQQCKLLC